MSVRTKKDAPTRTAGLKMEGEFGHWRDFDRQKSDDKMGRQSQDEFGQLRWAGREIYKMYGEYLKNLKQPYPTELVEAARKAKG